MNELNRQKKFHLKIINAGMYRAGTASLSLALQELGFGPTWQMHTNSDQLNEIGTKWWADNKVIERLHKGQHVDFDEWLKLIQCYTIMDTPVVHAWQQIFAQYPDCKVILSVRDFDNWWISYENSLRNLTGPTIQLCAKTDTFIRDVLKDVAKHHTGNGYTGAEELLSLNEEQRRKIYKHDIYDKHIEEVKSIVPKEQLLIFDVNNGWTELCNFLQVSIPNKPFPKINNSDQLNQFMYRWKMKALLSYFNMYYIIAVLVILVCCAIYLSKIHH
eukprot:392663_1